MSQDLKATPQGWPSGDTGAEDRPQRVSGLDFQARPQRAVLGPFLF